jgi:hypothetical protein
VSNPFVFFTFSGLHQNVGMRLIRFAVTFIRASGCCILRVCVRMANPHRLQSSYTHRVNVTSKWHLYSPTHTKRYRLLANQVSNFPPQSLVYQNCNKIHPLGAILISPATSIKMINVSRRNVVCVVMAALRNCVSMLLFQPASNKYTYS